MKRYCISVFITTQKSLNYIGEGCSGNSGARQETVINWSLKRHPMVYLPSLLFIDNSPADVNCQTADCFHSFAFSGPKCFNLFLGIVFNF